MSKPTIEVYLSSLKTGTVPTVTETVEVQQGENLDISVSWPNSASDTILCLLDFGISKNQDPFNDMDGGKTELSMTRASSNVAAVSTMSVKNDAKIGSDTYDLTLTIDGETYTKDPRIIIDPE